ncbi:hypothetical protein [Streptomyces sp. NPDC086023]|uniref:hypothetical protein n=1 Tax=Streptomyces sp. NPDC086023 TaxID=3365746 RepID=UPI0037CE8D87
MSGTGSTDSTWALSAKEGGGLAGRWWKWALSAPDDVSPVRDETGEFADWKQPRDLWFLAGTYGGKVVRRCAVPSDRPLFFPVLNMQHTREYSKVPQSMGVAEASATLNGIPLALQEFAAPFRTGLTRRFAWGIWCGITPLTPGEYVLEIRAEATNGFWVDTTYHLEVTAP